MKCWKLCEKLVGEIRKAFMKKDNSALWLFSAGEVLWGYEMRWDMRHKTRVTGVYYSTLVMWDISLFRTDHF